MSKREHVAEIIPYDPAIYYHLNHSSVCLSIAIVALNPKSLAARARNYSFSSLKIEKRTNHLWSFTSILSWLTAIRALSLSVKSSTFMTGIIYRGGEGKKKKTFLHDKFKLLKSIQEFFFFLNATHDCLQAAVVRRDDPAEESPSPRLNRVYKVICINDPNLLIWFQQDPRWKHAWNPQDVFDSKSTFYHSGLLRDSFLNEM